MEKLRSLGLKLIMLTGDHLTTAQSIAKKLGIEDVEAQVLPDQKSIVIKRLQGEGRRVAMAGDGINDAPALTQADVGVSMNDASQVAIQSARVILLNTDLNSVVKFLQISRHTLITIKQNLFWAFAYNIIAIPVAALGFLNPMVGAFTMAFSDVVVIGNSLRLKVKRLR